MIAIVRGIVVLDVAPKPSIGRCFEPRKLDDCQHAVVALIDDLQVSQWRETKT